MQKTLGAVSNMTQINVHNTVERETFVMILWPGVCLEKKCQTFKVMC